MKGRRILIADGSETFRTALAEELSGFFLVETCGNGKQTQSAIKDFNPDVLVIDLMIPELDGISLLKTALNQGMQAQILATTRYISDYVAESMSDMGVGYLMVKPCDIHATVDRIKDLAQKTRITQVLPQNRMINASSVLLHWGFLQNSGDMLACGKPLCVWFITRTNPLPRSFIPGSRACATVHPVKWSVQSAVPLRRPGITGMILCGGSILARMRRGTPANPPMLTLLPELRIC